ncbi:hypothetical protein BDV18DRAFT_21140 [Aspergillus unguis]
MDSNGIFTRSFDESLIRELPHLRIAPLREPVSSRNLQIPLPLEPNASGIRDPSAISKAPGSAGILPPLNEPGGSAGDGSNGARQRNDFAQESFQEPTPPRPILPAFVNLRALERFPYSSFDDDSHQSRKRRRLDLQSEPFGETLQLPMPQAQKEQKPPPFGPFAILNGLNEPPPNAALLPPIEAGSITQLLTKPLRYNLGIESTLLNTSFDPEAPNGERVEGRIADLLDSPIADHSSPPGISLGSDKIDEPASKPEHEHVRETERDPLKAEMESQTIELADRPLSPQTRGRSRRNLRRWSDEETVALLRGVMKCGIGNWKEILSQQESSFNQRSASNLKDRFRVCCPGAYRASDPEDAIQHLRDALAQVLSRLEAKSSSKEARIHRPCSAEPAASRTPGLTHSGSSSSFTSLEPSQNSPENYSPAGGFVSENPQSVPRGTTSLDLLDISEPYNPAKSRRRSRRPFTAEEDEALLKGYYAHGFQWTAIQQDEQLNLGHRRSTDLRDRFRTKFPHAYRDGGSVRGYALQALVVRDMILKNQTAKDAPESKQNAPVAAQASDNCDSQPDKVGSGTGTVDPDLPTPKFSPAPAGDFAAAPSAGPLFPLDVGSTASTSVGLAPLVWDDLS